MRLELLVLLVNAAAGIFMAGFIWTMQLIHYPLFDYVGEEAFPPTKSPTIGSSYSWPAPGYS